MNRLRYKKIGYLLSISVFLIFSPISSAIEVPSEIGFEENMNSSQPVEPEEGRPIEPNQPPTTGPLSLNYASNIYFGKQKIGSSSQVFYALPDKVRDLSSGNQEERVNFIQLTDNRGTFSGWTLSVKQNGPFQNAKGVSINGAQICIDNIEVVDVYNVGHLPTELHKNIVLNSQGTEESVIAKATEGTGMGMWTIVLGSQKEKSSSVRLTVPKDEPKEPGIYTTTLSWILQDVL